MASVKDVNKITTSSSCFTFLHISGLIPFIQFVFYWNMGPRRQFWSWFCLWTFISIHQEMKVTDFFWIGYAQDAQILNKIIPLASTTKIVPFNLWSSWIIRVCCVQSTCDVMRKPPNTKSLAKIVSCRKEIALYHFNLRHLHHPLSWKQVGCLVWSQKPKLDFGAAFKTRSAQPSTYPEIWSCALDIS